MIFISNMEIPDSCDYCPIFNSKDGICNILAAYHHDGEDRIDGCPLKGLDDLTICGYSVKALTAFADACRKNGVDKRDLKAFANNCLWALQIVSEEQKKVFEEAWKKSFGGVLCVEDLP